MIDYKPLNLKLMTNNEKPKTRHPVRRRRIIRGQRLLYGSCDYELCLRLMGWWMGGKGFCPGDRIVIGVELGRLSVYKEEAIQ